MFTRTIAITIARPIEEVFAFVSDARNRPRWDESVDSEELTSPSRSARAARSDADALDGP